MTIFLDRSDQEYGALTEIKVSHAVNGERSISGTIFSNDKVLHAIDAGWRLRHEDEYYVIIYAKPVDVGNKVQVVFDAVHQFFWDFSKAMVYSQLKDGSHTFETYLDFIFSGSGYRYVLEGDVRAFEKESFGMKSRLALFQDVIKKSGLEFSVSGKVVRILRQVGTDLSTVVRKHFNMNELTIEKNIGRLITYQRGFGAWQDDNDHSKGRLEVEYASPLVEHLGRLEGDPVMDERYTNRESLLAVLKANVDSSYTVSVRLDMEDLTRAGYRYTQPVAGDYIMAINETLGFRERLRIVSFVSEYDVSGQLVSHEVTCNDIGSVKRQANAVISVNRQVSQTASETAQALEVATKALVSADGKNTVYASEDFPQDKPKGRLKIGDTLYRQVGDRTLMYFWNGAEWEEPPVVNDVQRFKDNLRTEFAQIRESMAVNDRERQGQIAELLRKAGANQSLAEEAKRLGSQATTSASQALTSAVQAKTEAILEAKRLATVERQETERRLALAKSQVITEATRLVEGARSQLTGQLSRAEGALERAKTALETQVSGVTMEVTQTKESLKTLATKSDLDKTKQRVSIAETSLTQQAGQIALKANQETVDTLTRRVKTAETSIRQQADQIELKASRSDVAGLANRVSGAEASLRVQANQIALKASQSALDGLTGRVSSAESSLLVQANQISQLVRSSDFDPVRQRLTRAESSITQLGSRITTEIEQVTSKVDRLKLGSRNYAEDYSFTRGLWEYSQGDNSRANWQVADGVYTVTGTTDTWKQYQIYSESGSRRGGKSDSTALLELVEGETYTLSVEAKVVSGSPEFWLELRDNGLRQYDAVVTHLFGVKQASSQWVRYTVTGVIKPNTDFSHRRIILGYSKVGTMAFRKVELTKSSQAMDAGPALEDLGADLERVKTTITQTAEGVSQVSSRLSETAGRVTQTETQIRHLVGEVSSKVAQRDYDRLAGKVSSNSTAIGQTSAALELKADKTVTDSLQGTVNQTKAELTILDNAVKTKVAQTDFDNAKVRLSTAESSIQTMAGQIETKLSRVDATKIVTNSIEQSERGMTARISQLEGKIPLETSGNLLVASGDGWRNLHQKDFVISEPMYAGSTYTITVRWWREDGSRLNFGIRQTASDSWQWVDLEYNRQIDAWTKTFSLTKSLNAGDRVSFFTVEQNGRGSGAWATLTKGTTPLSVWEPSYKELVTETKFHEVKDTVDSHTRTIGEQGESISQVVQTANGLVTRVENLSVGGRNWVRGSSQMRKGSGTWESGTFRHSGSGRSEQMTILDFPGNELVSGIRLVGQGAGIAQDACFVTEGPWTMSYWVNGQKGTQVRLQAYWSSSNSQTGVSPTVTLKGGWERLSFSAYNREAGRCSIAYLYLVTGQEVVVARPQLENGALLTDYRPAPEDGEKELTATKTEVSQLAGSYAIRNLTSAGTILNQLNLNRDGSVKIDGQLVQITGQTYIQDGVITSAKIADLDAGKIRTGQLNAANVDIVNLNVNQLVGLDASFIRSKIEYALIDWLKGKTIAAQNGAMMMDLNEGALNFFTENPAMRRAVPGYGNQFIKFATGHFNQTGQWQDSFESNQTIIGSNRNGIESVEDGGFAGFRIWNMRVNNGRQADMADMIDVIGDRIVFQDAATGSTRSPWILETYSGSHDLRFYPRNDNGRRHHLGAEGNKFKTIHGEDIYANQIIIGGERLAMMLKDLANKIGYSGVNGWADRMR